MGAGERLDQHCPPAFAQRLCGDECLGGGDRFVGPTGAEQGGGVGFPCRASTFLETAGLGADAVDIGAVAVSGAVPQVECGGEQVSGLGRVGAAGGVDEVLRTGRRRGRREVRPGRSRRHGPPAQDRGGRVAATRTCGAWAPRVGGAASPHTTSTSASKPTTSPWAASRTASSVRWLVLPIGQA